MNAPATPTEKLVAEVLCEVLEVDTVDLTEDFFALGGHSLLAVRVVQELADRTNTSLDLASFFELGNGQDVAAELDRLQDADARRPEPVVEEGEL